MTRIIHPTPARIVLRGHGSVPAELEVVQYPRARWVLRTLGYVLLWVFWTLGTLLFTFDPFVASFPFVLGERSPTAAGRGDTRSVRSAATARAARMR